MQAPPPPPPPKEMATTNPQQHEPPRVHPRIIPIEDISDHSESDGEENYRRGLSAKNSIIRRTGGNTMAPSPQPGSIAQFDGESDPEEFLLKYEATIEAAGGGTACKAKALVLALRGLAQHWYANIPPRSILSWN